MDGVCGGELYATFLLQLGENLHGKKFATLLACFCGAIVLVEKLLGCWGLLELAVLVH